MTATEGLQFRVRCVQCGGMVCHVNSTPGGMLAVAIVACVDCGCQMEITARTRLHKTERFH